MKVDVYAVWLAIGWIPYLTVDRSVDRLFWLNRDFREGVREALGLEDSTLGAYEARAIVQLRQPIPLGWAEAVRVRLQAEWARREKDRSIEAVQRELRETVQSVTRIYEGKAATVDMEAEIVTPAPQVASAERYRAEGRALALRVARLPQQLAGRALLLGEAAAMLAAPDAAALLRELQLAALLGAARPGSLRSRVD
ncbi:hypothetical protein [Cohnella nanjingensis]|uniref:Uncharacterized protein n=1 Tax=Cohnella nanjingensis TaxID=1387779 RepID=A0A7X0RNB3_9BACL|nr:hypothetical protein [Cohnella nanjingensis]MBB6670637.1 hypothetical protein [Cohnella nanjingensis]